PMFMRLVPNYILEISRPEEHALYLAAFNTTRMVGAFLSFAVGGAIVWLGHLWVFLIVMVITAVGAWCMLGLIEPRERRRPEFEPEPREL
ncbi:MAG: MFS transporter, partial [Planctomycetes bacterium]|nr:MFS transporter [Planctomycetota bacterium]